MGRRTPAEVDCTISETLANANVQVSAWLKDYAESKHAAVYAVVGKDETVSFVGVSRNVALSLVAHIQNEGEDKVHSLKVRSAVSCITTAKRNPYGPLRSTK